MMLPLIGLSIFTLDLQKDTRAEAFLPPGHPAVEYRHRVEEIFGLKDPMLVAVINRGAQGIYNPKSLNLISWLSEQIANLPGVDPDRVMSLSTEKDLSGGPDGLLIEPFLDGLVETSDEAARVRRAVMGTSLYVGSLVSENGQGALIAAELADPDAAEEIYELLLDLTRLAPAGPENELHVAGEGALVGNLGAYIDRDAKRLTPAVAVVVLFLLFLSYRTVLGVILPALVAVFTLGTVLGTMSLAGKAFYFLTNGLPVILIAISVADTIHILGQFYHEQTSDSFASRRTIVIRSMRKMWRPVTITSLTTIAGFLAVYVTSTSPPMKDFGVFAALGIAVALVISVTIVPALLLLIPHSTPPVSVGAKAPNDLLSVILEKLETPVLSRPRLVLLTAALVGLGGILGLMQLETDESDIANFKEHEQVRISHETINQIFDGANNLDVVIETPAVEGLFDPARLRRIESLQAYMESLPHVTGSRSIVDYIKQMNRALNEDREDAYVLPDSEEAVAQYFLLYSMSGDPSDFEEEVDYDYRLANVRVTMDSGRFTHERPVVSAIENYVANEFNSDDLSARVSGRVAVHYYWMIELMEGHAFSVMLALAAVGLMTFMSFRSFLGAGLALLPVALSVLLVYAIMGFSNIWLGIGTSMSAAIAIGIGVDFAVHVIDRIKILVGENRLPIEEALPKLYETTGRALSFNFMIVFLGFGLLVVSEAPALVRFGSLVSIAVATSFVSSLVLLPVLVRYLQPTLWPESTRESTEGPVRTPEIASS